jgi:DNA polymerase-3 subunit chi
MAQVSFYLIQTQQRQAELACRVCRKIALVEKIPLLVKCAKAAELEHFDALLWQFEPSSFVAHDVDDTTSPICLSLQIPDSFQGFCLNLSDQVVDHSRFERVIEIIENNEQAKNIGRQKFKAYREQGIEPVTFKV